MKKSLILLTIPLLLTCSDNESNNNGLDSKEIAGIWVPFEISYSDGTIHNGPFTSSSIFGVYAESVQLNLDKTYYPVSWIDENHYLVKTEEAGDFEFNQNDKQLSFKSGPWDIEFRVIKITGSELWISSEDVQYKLRRELEF